MAREAAVGGLIGATRGALAGGARTFIGIGAPYGLHRVGYRLPAREGRRFVQRGAAIGAGILGPIEALVSGVSAHSYNKRRAALGKALLALGLAGAGTGLGGYLYSKKRESKE